MERAGPLLPALEMKMMPCRLTTSSSNCAKRLRVYLCVRVCVCTVPMCTYGHTQVRHGSLYAMGPDVCTREGKITQVPH